jgi:hypothetical protein
MREAIIAIGEHNGLELAVLPRGEKSVGDVILTPDSPALIHGVSIEPLRVYPDDRGFFMELERLGSAGLAEKMLPGGEARIQISPTLTYPGRASNLVREKTLTREIVTAAGRGNWSESSSRRPTPPS